ncbi:DUF899 domain-containing protein, partial [bacterium M00.F.Ca.ET.159.01.1.1]
APSPRSRPSCRRARTAKLARQDQPCPSCTALLDQFDGAVGHLEAAGFNFAVVAKTGVAAGDERIIGVMIESNLVAGRQDVVPGKPLTYGQSITDGC